MRFVFSLDDMDNFSTPVKSNLLKQNLGSVEMLIELICFNFDTVGEEMAFIFSKE